jgi:sortase (surface protein transpeptidase)
MIFTLLSRFIGDTDTKYIKTFIIGSVIYILIHAIVNSPFGNNNEMILKYRNYLYLIFGIDCVLSGVVRGMFNKKDNNYDNDEEQEESEKYNDEDNEYSEHVEEEQQQPPKLERTYPDNFPFPPNIPEEYKELYFRRAMMVAQHQNTPFIKHEQYSEQNEKNIPQEEPINKQEEEPKQEPVQAQEEYIEESEREEIHINTLDSENIPVFHKPKQDDEIPVFTK